MARYGPGDVIWGPDAYHDDDPELELGSGRPWLIISSGVYPGQGNQYLCCAMTSGSGTGDAFVPAPLERWTDGSPKKTAFVDTETVVTMKSNWITRYVGALDRDTRQRARKLVKSYLS